MKNKEKDELLEAADSALNGVVELFKKVSSTVKSEFNAAKMNTEQDWDGIGKELKSTVEEVKQTLKTLLDGVAEEFVNYESKKNKTRTYIIKLHSLAPLLDGRPSTKYLSNIIISPEKGLIVGYVLDFADATEFSNFNAATKLFNIIRGDQSSLNYVVSIVEKIKED